ncbi:MAG: DUF6112 family protein [Solirubrobacteraceae bacterium]
MRLQGLKRRSVAAIVGLTAPLITAAPAFAAGGGGGAGGVNITPNSSGLPGISQGETIVGALLTFGVIAAVAGLIMGAMVWAVGHHSSNPQVVSRGKTGVMAGVVAAILCGGAMAIVNFFFNIGAGL